MDILDLLEIEERTEELMAEVVCHPKTVYCTLSQGRLRELRFRHGDRPDGELVAYCVAHSLALERSRSV